MSVSIYDAFVPVSIRALTNLDHILTKGAAHAAANDIDPLVLTSARLFPDMFALSSQVQVATDISRRGAQRLAGIEPPEMSDIGTSFDALRTRCRESIEAIKAIDAGRFEGAETRTIELKLRGEDVTFTGHEYVFGFVMPNLYFHITTAYNILRHNGVKLGKADFLGGR